MGRRQRKSATATRHRVFKPSGLGERPVTSDDVRHLTVAEADAIYQSLYWHAMRCDLLPISIALMVFDFGVNAGPGTSVRQLQAAIGVTVDGIVGPVTARATRGTSRWP